MKTIARGSVASRCRPLSKSVVLHRSLVKDVRGLSRNQAFHRHLLLASGNGESETKPADESKDETPGVVSEQAASPETVSSFPLKDEDMEDMFAAKELVDELKDVKELGKRGEGWFLAQAAVIFLLIVPPLALKGLIDLVGAISITAGLIVIGYALYSLGRNLSPLPMPRQKSTLVVSGMYSYVRHPMYGGLLLFAFGLACVTRSEARIALTALLWWILEQKVATEEKMLTERYSSEYEEYQKTVKKFFPYLY